MAIDNEIRDEKLQYDINRGAAKISPLSLGKIDKYEYFTDKEILPSYQKRVIEQTKFTYASSGKALEKQSKTIEDQGKKQIKVIEDHGKQLVESNELIKEDFNRMSNKKIFNELIRSNKCHIKCFKRKFF